MAALLTFLANHKALIACLIYGISLIAAGQVAAGIGVILAALSGGIKPPPPPPV